MPKSHFNLKVNDINNLEMLLQELYDVANNNYKQIEDEYIKVVNSTVVNDLDVDGKAKYSAAISKFLELKQKSIAQKTDIAKIMGEIYKNNGNIEKGLSNSKESLKKLDFKAMRSMAENAKNDETDNNGKMSSEIYRFKM